MRRQHLPAPHILDFTSKPLCIQRNVFVNLVNLKAPRYRACRILEPSAENLSAFSGFFWSFQLAIFHNSFGLHIRSTHMQVVDQLNCLSIPPTVKAHKYSELFTLILYFLSHFSPITDFILYLFSFCYFPQN